MVNRILSAVHLGTLMTNAVYQSEPVSYYQQPRVGRRNNK